MLDVEIKNKSLIQALDWFAEIIMSTPIEVRNRIEYPDFDMDAETACSIEYLQKYQAGKEIESGWPHHIRGLDMLQAKESSIPTGWKEHSKEFDRMVIEAIGVEFPALKCYYPEDGYIGWHNNCNCPGQNLLLTYSTTGNGYFEYQDRNTREIVRMNDRPGWTAKVGYYGSDQEDDQIFWHCARTWEPRITMSYVIRDQWMWEEMVADIQSDQ